MKKLFVAAFIGALTLTSCSKKAESTESNTMMTEPDSAAMKSDSSATAQPMDSTAAAMPAKTDSAMAK
ncbi:hypothetical protein SAMN05421847_2678 [Halpernia humi]|uniref:Cytochrome C551 n=1 Tax=Halpernia humi TaxID=493375 RepID=A0A1H6B4L2_9FLAO|nr:hypothetical protein [Halpernia humi]SEG55076.1 hypothetical protein SAMN05421847_2678 [Halpernia humi]